MVVSGAQFTPEAAQHASVSVVKSDGGKASSIVISFDDPVLSSRHFDVSIMVGKETSAALLKVFAVSMDKAGNALPVSVTHSPTIPGGSAVLKASVRHWSSIIIRASDAIERPQEGDVILECDIPPFDPDVKPESMWRLLEPFTQMRRAGRLSKPAACRLSEILGRTGLNAGGGNSDLAELCFFEAALCSAFAHGLETPHFALALNNYAATLFNSYRCSAESAAEMLRVGACRSQEIWPRLSTSTLQSSTHFVNHLPSAGSVRASRQPQWPVRKIIHSAMFTLDSRVWLASETAPVP
jgi:hypothetical protein